MTSRTLSAEQLERLIDASLDPEWDSETGDDGSRFLALASHAAVILDVPVAVMAMAKGSWSIEARSHVEPFIELNDDAMQQFTSFAGDEPSANVLLWTDPAGVVWTLVALHLHPPAIVALIGDWTASSERLLLWARSLSATSQAASTRARARARLSAHRLTRTLARANGMSDVCTAILRSMAWAVRARLAALAVPTPPENHLAVVATRGYSLELVKHLRIPPGSGVIGSVFLSGRMLLGRPSTDLDDSKRRRPRYRTDSFVAVPISSTSDVLGVVCVTDRIDDQPFTREDMATLRVLAAPAALALARENALSQMRQFAYGAAVDPLSGCFNRRHFQARLDEELQRSSRDRLTLALLMIDIDDFKLVNDSFGHVVGDTVIKDVADILRRSVRGFDVCARFGGEEFAVLMPASTVESATKVATRIRERIETYRPSSASPVHVTVSVGLSVSSTTSSASDLIARADDALYVAKREGKNRIRIFPPEPADRVTRPAEVGERS